MRLTVSAIVPQYGFHRMHKAYTFKPTTAHLRVASSSSSPQPRCRCRFFFPVPDASSCPATSAQDSVSFWESLYFENLTELESLEIFKCPPVPLDCLQKLSSLKNLWMLDAIWAVEDWSHVGCKFPALERMAIMSDGASRKELTQLLSCMPKLSKLSISGWNKITGVGVVEQHKAKEEEEIAKEGLLLLPPQLQELHIDDCRAIRLCPDSLQGLCSLRSLHITNSCHFRSPSSCFLFPTSLQSLDLTMVRTSSRLSNLTSLTKLWAGDCRGLGGADLGRLLAHGCLRELFISRTPDFFSIGPEEPPMPQQGLSFPSSKLLSLWTDDFAGVLDAPICRLLSSYLTELAFSYNHEMGRLTKEQDDALQLLTSLQKLDLSFCKRLQCLPAGLHRLTNLKRLEIAGSPAICSLHKDGLPDSLQELYINDGDIRSLHKDSLPNSLQKLEISSCSGILAKDGLPNSLQELDILFCPSIRALPKGGLPTSLLVLDVCLSDSKELKRQCRKLIGTIPIVKLHPLQ